MSAKNRGTIPQRHAFYPTDPRLVRGLLRAIKRGHGPPLIGLNKQVSAGEPLPIWCDPCAGDGAIVRAVEGFAPNLRTWVTADIRPDATADIVGDFRDPELAAGADVYLTNPPYTDEATGEDLALAFAQQATKKRAPGGEVILLVRYGFFTAVSRQPFINSSGHWDEYPLSPRPSFGLDKHGRKGTDATEYVWIRQGPETTSRRWPAIDWRKA